VIQVDELEVRDNLIVETWPVRIEDREVRCLRGKKIVLVKAIWVGPTSESATWESESRMRVSYPELFSSGNFRGRNSLGGRVVTPCLLLDFLLIIFLCLYVLVCDYISLCVLWLRLLDFSVRRVLWSFQTRGYFSHFIE